MDSDHPAPVLPQAPAAERNKAPILDVLQRVLPEDGLVLEIASGTGQHAAYFARQLPGSTWQPSEPDRELIEVISARVRAAALPNLRAPLRLDVHESPWPVDSADAIVCINMIHIAPWSATDALFHGALTRLKAGSPLVLYGPFRIGGAHTAPSNEAFDASLRARNSEWGVRELDEVAAVARRHGFDYVEHVAMPANNFTVVFRRRTNI